MSESSARTRPGRGRPDYQMEPPSQIRDQAFVRRHLTALELFRIAAWKSAKSLAPLSLNSEDLIEELTGVAVRAIKDFGSPDVLDPTFSGWDEWELAAATAIGRSASKRPAVSGSGLLGLSGVGYPMATAIVSFLAPQTFPIMDRWTVRAVFGRDRVDSDLQRCRVYRQFAKHLVRAHALPAYQHLSTIHAVDQAIMNAEMGKPGSLPSLAFFVPPIGINPDR